MNNSHKIGQAKSLIIKLIFKNKKFLNPLNNSFWQVKKKIKSIKIIKNTRHLFKIHFKINKMF